MKAQLKHMLSEADDGEPVAVETVFAHVINGINFNIAKLAPWCSVDDFKRGQRMHTPGNMARSMV